MKCPTGLHPYLYASVRSSTPVFTLRPGDGRVAALRAGRGQLSLRRTGFSGRRRPELARLRGMCNLCRGEWRAPTSSHAKVRDCWPVKTFCAVMHEPRPHHPIRRHIPGSINRAFRPRQGTGGRALCSRMNIRAGHAPSASGSSNSSPNGLHVLMRRGIVRVIMYFEWSG
jgi:hypothetical protein